MIDINKIRAGSKIEYRGEPFYVLKAVFSKIGRQGAVLRTKLENLKTGGSIETTFRDSDKLEEPELTKSKAQFLYRQGEDYYFMNLESYDQFFLKKAALSQNVNFLVEGAQIEIIYYKEDPINIELPIKLIFKVIEAPPAIKGDTADGGSKKVTIETGYELNVPLFIKEEDSIVINTQEGNYVSRA